MVIKTDRKDARGIAQLLRMGWFRPVSSPAEEPDQGLRLACHLRLAHDLAGAIHHAHAALFQ